MWRRHSRYSLAACPLIITSKYLPSILPTYVLYLRNHMCPKINGRMKIFFPECFFFTLDWKEVHFRHTTSTERRIMCLNWNWQDWKSCNNFFPSKNITSAPFNELSIFSQIFWDPYESSLIYYCTVWSWTKERTHQPTKFFLLWLLDKMLT